MTTKSHSLVDATIGGNATSPEFSGHLGTAGTYVEHTDGKKAVNFKAANGTGSSAYDTGFNHDLMSKVYVLRVKAVGSTNCEMSTVRNASAKAGSGLITTGAIYQLRSGADAVVYSTTALTVGVDYIVRECWNAGSTITDGAAWGEVVPLAGGSALGTGSATNLDNKQSNLTQQVIGKITAASNGFEIEIAALKTVDGVFADGTSSAKLDPAYPPPVAVVVEGDRYLVDLRGSTGVGNTYTLTAGALTVDEILDGLFLITQGSATVTASYSITDDLGQVTNGTLAVPPAGGVRPAIVEGYFNGTAFVYE